MQEERSKVDDLRGTPMSVGTLEEIIDDNHAIVSTSVGSEHYVSILSFVDKDQLEPGCSVLLNHKVFILSCTAVNVLLAVLFTRATLTSRCSAETAKCRITQTVPHDSPGTLVFWCQKSW